MNSDGHRGNILNPGYTEFGVGYYSGSGQFPSYWVQDFGVRSDVTPMILAGEAATTTTRDIDVYVHGTWNQMRLRNDNGDWSDWQPFANSFTWTINDGRGEHYVAAELRNGGTTAHKLRHDHLGCACRLRRHGRCAQEALPAGHPEWAADSLRIGAGDQNTARTDGKTNM